MAKVYAETRMICIVSIWMPLRVSDSFRDKFLLCSVHGHDFATVGPKQSLEVFKKELETKYELKKAACLWADFRQQLCVADRRPCFMQARFMKQFFTF